MKILKKSTKRYLAVYEKAVTFCVLSYKTVRIFHNYF